MKTALKLETMITLFYILICFLIINIFMTVIDIVFGEIYDCPEYIDNNTRILHYDVPCDTDPLDVIEEPK